MVRPAPAPERGRFGRIDFQLMLLRRMADYQPGLVEDKIRELGFDRSEVRAAHRRWQEIVRSRSFPGGMARYRIVLGRPARTLERQFGDLTCEVTQWELELWPGLWFETIAVPGPRNSRRMQISMLMITASAALNACSRRGNSSVR